jgi:hypothetical protein
MGTFAGTATVTIVGTYTKASDLFVGGVVGGTINESNASTYANGIGSNQINAYFADTRTLAATNESFDLNAITDAYGTVLNFLTIKLLYIKNKSTNVATAENLLLSGNFLDGDAGNGPLGGTSPIVVIGAGGSFLWNSPIIGATVTNTTKDAITLTNTVSFDYDIIIGGTV